MKVVKADTLKISLILSLVADTYHKEKQAAAKSEKDSDRGMIQFWTGALWAIQNLSKIYKKEISDIDDRTYNIWVKAFISGIVFTLFSLGLLTFIFS